jgi:glycogen operon protein
MLLMGDEVRRTQRGNNNAYNQDGEINWFDWTLVDRHADIHRFVKALTAFRQRRDVVGESATLTLDQFLSRTQIEWHGVELNRPDWNDHSHSLAVTLRSFHSRFLLHGVFNAYWEPLTFQLPPVPEGSAQSWRRCIDTALASPDDICAWDKGPAHAQSTYVVQPRSTVVLALALGNEERRTKNTVLRSFHGLD